ncbi:tRNA glutamyl-Q(34) synthetase GluQRS [Roseibium sediminis]|uniref:tRNA glutamyl-Q(34) synthetase GluQRS n=1 Tax=Roseibium sediminis TaxID=1775174 RepID=UPI00123E13C8|nr:tRNA glutamyl-Q(34) synthetase GluQRS [Roseibium sediminis]
MSSTSHRVFRFAPSPNGHLHLGHALSALLNVEAAERLGGTAFLRVENIDEARCTANLEQDLYEDLEWIGYPLVAPILRQSERFEAYRSALVRLEEMGLVYRAYLTRAEIKRAVGEAEARGIVWPRDPDGAPLYPRDTAVLTDEEIRRRRDKDAPYALRLDMAGAVARAGADLSWQEAGSEGTALEDAPERIMAEPAQWGDVILARKDTPTSYHLSVVVDDAEQGITDVLRGTDLYAATSVHRLLQRLLDLPEPIYRHHRLILGEDGRKLSKSARDTSLRMLRAEGVCVSDIRRLVGLG